MDDPYSLLLLIAIVVLLLLSALISGSEIAFFSLTPTNLDELENDSSGKLISKLLQKPKVLLATILVANNFINIAIVIISTYLTAIMTASISGWLKFTVEVVVVTFLILLFGEILPKVYANRNPIKFAKLMATPLLILQKLLFPVSVFLIKSSNLVEKKLNKEKLNLSVDQLSQAIVLASDKDTTKEEQKIFEGIVSFGETEARQIMRPRIDVFALEDILSSEEVLAQVSTHGFSRIPVFHDDMDNIVGVLFAKDLLPFLNNADFDWLSLLRDPFFVPENMKLDDLLQDFQEKKTHLAVVVDEYGGTSGIITLEDVIEEIVGEITDEYDQDEVNYYKINHDTYEFDGKTSLKDFYKVVEMPEKDEELFEEHKGDAESIAGFFLEQSGKFPNKNQLINFKGYQLTATSVDGKRIKKVKIKLA
jgi:gliding motility-associated protein GldE